jgi:hypothetical protein
MVESKSMKTLNEIAYKLNISTPTLSAKCRDGSFKTARKIRENHIDTWYIDDKEAEDYITNFKPYAKAKRSN